MSAGTINRRLFVVGCPRSGTTLLQGLLGTHPLIASFPESHFFDFGFIRPKLSRFHYVASLARDLPAQFLSDAGVDEELTRNLLARRPRLPLIPGTGLERWGRYFISVLDAVAKGRQRDIWVEKTPDHLRRIDLIERMAPEPVFIHIIRSGPDTVASLYKASRGWQRPLSVAATVQLWNTNLALSAVRMAAGRDHFVGYDQLAGDPAAAMSRLCGRLGLEFDSRWIEGYAESVSQLQLDREIWKAGSARAIAPRSTFHDTFDDTQQRYVLEHIDRQLYDELAARL